MAPFAIFPTGHISRPCRSDPSEMTIGKSKKTREKSLLLRLLFFCVSHLHSRKVSETRKNSIILNAALRGRNVIPRNRRIDRRRDGFFRVVGGSFYTGVLAVDHGLIAVGLGRHDLICKNVALGWISDFDCVTNFNGFRNFVVALVCFPMIICKLYESIKCFR